MVKLFLEILKADDVASVNPVDVADKVYPSPILLMIKSEKVARPSTAATVNISEIVAPFGFVPKA